MVNELKCKIKKPTKRKNYNVALLYLGEESMTYGEFEKIRNVVNKILEVTHGTILY